jgi:hypothetical protein
MGAARHRVSRGDHPTTITVHVPIAVRRRGGRKSLSAPNMTIANVVPSGGEPTVSPVLRALARAFRWRRLIETGVHATVQDIAAAERINPSYVSRVVRLTLLAPEIVETILDQSMPWHAGLSVDMLMRAFPTHWKGQRLNGRSPMSWDWR